VRVKGLYLNNVFEPLNHIKMEINACAKFVAKVEKWRSPFAIQIIKLLVHVPVERSVVDPYIEKIEKLHITCCKHAVEFFNGNNAVLRFEQNYDHWYEQNMRFLRYLPVIGKELNERFGEEVMPKEMLAKMDFSAVLQPPEGVRN